jgi:hypothetical protein
VTTIRTRRRLPLLLAPATLVAVLLAPGGARVAHAEESLLETPRHRQGYYLAFGLNAALAYAREDGEGIGPTYGQGFQLRFGQLLTPRLGLGLAIDFSGTASGEDSASFGALSLAGQVEIACNLAVHAAVGLSIVTLTSETDDADEPLRGVYGAAYTVGLTYDWFLGNRKSGGWALTPGVQLRATPGDTFAFGAFVGLEITRWTGLPKNQLELDTSEAYK